MSIARHMPRALAAGVAALLGAGGLSIAAMAQESQTPSDSTTATTAPLREGPSQSDSSGPARSGARQNGERIENIAADLTLESARIESMNLDDTDSEYAVFSFGRVVHDIRNASDFVLKGFNVATQAKGDEARLVQGHPASVLVAFPSGTDLSRYTLASVATGAVEDEAGEANLPGSVPLKGSSVADGTNLTDGPDLLSLRAIDSLERVEYRYDEQLDENGGNAADFGYYTTDGLLVSGQRIVTSEDNAIIVEFDRQIEDGVAFFAKAGAVKNRHGIASAPGAIGTATTAPDLSSVSNVIGKTQWDFTYDAPVTDIDVNKFVVYSADGTAYRAKGYAQPSAEVVRIAIPELHDFSANMVWAAAEDGAVKANDGSDVGSTLGARRIGNHTAASGPSAGPPGRAEAGRRARS